MDVIVDCLFVCLFTCLLLSLQTCVLGIHRCDYMLDWRETDGLALRQIEMNTISCGMMGLNAGLKSFHE